MPEFTSSPFARPVRPEWLHLRDEAVLEPSLPIIDTHHHFSEFPGAEYLLADLQADLASGHNIVSTVFVEGRTRYRSDGDAALRPVGETAFVRTLSRQARSGPTRIAVGMVANAQLDLGDAVSNVIEAHIEAAEGALRGIRQIAPWDPDPALRVPGLEIPQGLLLDTNFRRGFARLAEYELSFDAWLYPAQFGDLLSLARAFPNVRIVIDFAPPMRLAESAHDRGDQYARWRTAVRLVAQAQNVWMKLGGVGMPMCGFNFFAHKLPPSSAQIAEAWRPYFETCLDAFGVQRCLLGSNFPVDKGSFSYRAFWNACKRLTQALGADERDAMFRKNAVKFYRLETDGK
jgi:L-fuconolactonase